MNRQRVSARAHDLRPGDVFVYNKGTSLERRYTIVSIEILPARVLVKTEHKGAIGVAEFSTRDVFSVEREVES